MDTLSGTSSVLSQIDFSRLSVEDVRALKRVYGSMERAVRAKDAELHAVRGQLQELHTAHTRFRNKVAALESVRDLTVELQGQMQFLQGQLQKERQKSAELENALAVARNTVEQVGTATSQREGRISELEATVAALANESAVSVQKHRSARKVAEDELEARKRSEAEIRKLEHEIRNLTVENDGLRNSIAEYEDRLGGTSKELSQSVSQVEVLTRDLDQLSTMRDNQKTQERHIETLRADNARLARLLSSTTEYANFAELWNDSVGVSFVVPESVSGTSHGSNLANAPALEEPTDEPDAVAARRTNASILTDAPSTLGSSPRRRPTTLTTTGRRRKRGGDRGQRTPGGARGSSHNTAGPVSWADAQDLITKYPGDPFPVMHTPGSAMGSADGLGSSSTTMDESAFWVPKAVMRVANDFHVQVMPHAPRGVMDRFLRMMNKAWRAREKRRLHRIRTKHAQQVAALRRRLNMSKSYQLVIADTTIARLERDVRDLREDLAEERLRTKQRLSEARMRSLHAGIAPEGTLIEAVADGTVSAEDAVESMMMSGSGEHLRNNPAAKAAMVAQLTAPRSARECRRRLQRRHQHSVMGTAEPLLSAAGLLIPHSTLMDPHYQQETMASVSWQSPMMRRAGGRRAHGHIQAGSSGADASGLWLQDGENKVWSTGITDPGPGDMDVTKKNLLEASISAVEALSRRVDRYEAQNRALTNELFAGYAPPEAVTGVGGTDDGSSVFFDEHTGGRLVGPPTSPMGSRLARTPSGTPGATPGADGGQGGLASAPFLAGAMWLGRNMALVVEELADWLEELQARSRVEVSALAQAEAATGTDGGIAGISANGNGGEAAALQQLSAASVLRNGGQAPHSKAVEETYMMRQKYRRLLSHLTLVLKETDGAVFDCRTRVRQMLQQTAALPVGDQSGFRELHSALPLGRNSAVGHAIQEASSTVPASATMSYTNSNNGGVGGVPARLRFDAQQEDYDQEEDDDDDDEDDDDADGEDDDVEGNAAIETKE